MKRKRSSINHPRIRFGVGLILALWVTSYLVGAPFLYTTGGEGHSMITTHTTWETTTSRAGKHFFSSDVDLRGLLQARANDNVIVLTGFNFGYKDVFLNLLCQLDYLNLQNYVVAAFDVQGYDFCLAHGLPCFSATSVGMDSPEISDSELLHDSLPHAWTTDQFKKLTKRKSQEALRVLELGYDILWTDVDVFWKSDPLGDISKWMNDSAQIHIQSDALWGIDPNSWVNSGFYFVRSSHQTINVFKDIISNSRTSNESEQPSFNRVLCQERVSPDECHNIQHDVVTRVLDRERYVHGASYHIYKDVTRQSRDNVIMFHANYRAGVQEKEEALKAHGFWLLGNGCSYLEGKTNTPQ